MKKIIITVILIVLFNNNGWTQKSGFDYLSDTINMPVTKGVREYYYFRNRAIDEIIKENKKLAIEYFIKAFTFKLPFPQDLNEYSDLINTTKTLDSSCIVTMLINLKKIGWFDSTTIDYFEKDRPELLQQSYWKYIHNITDSTKVLISFNDQITKTDLLLLARDQNIRNECNSKYGSIWVGTPCEKEASKIDSLNLIELIGLLKKYPISNNFNNLRGMRTICLHFTRRYWGQWIPYVLKMTREGLINNDFIADLLDQYQTNYINKYKKDKERDYIFAYSTSNALFDKYSILILPDTVEKQINDLRKSIFLDSYKITEERKAWVTKQMMLNPDTSYSFIGMIWYLTPHYYKGISENEAQEGKKQQEKILKDENFIKDHKIIDLR